MLICTRNIFCLSFWCQ